MRFSAGGARAKAHFLEHLFHGPQGPFFHQLSALKRQRRQKTYVLPLQVILTVA